MIQSTSFGQAPTTKIDGYWCRDSIAENKVIELKKKADSCEDAVNQSLESIDIKNAQIDNLNERIVLKDSLCLEEKEVLKLEHKDKIKKKNKKIAFSVILNAILIGALIL